MQVLVLDIGGSAVKYALMNEKAEMIDKGEKPTPLSSKEDFLDVIEAIHHQYEHEAEGMALSMPGNLDSETGKIYTPGALTFNYNSNIFDMIHTRIPNLQLSVQNDGKCAALAELWQGNLKNAKNGAVLVLGTGIGGGLIVERKVLIGSHFFAGELSYLIEDGNQPSVDKVFAMNGGTAALCAKAAIAKGLDPKTVNGKMVFEWIGENDEAALHVFDEFAKHIAVQIFNIQCFIDPEIVCIGGGVSKQPILLDKIREKLDEVYQLFPFAIPKAELMACKFNNDSNLIGALYNYLEHFHSSELN